MQKQRIKEAIENHILQQARAQRVRQAADMRVEEAESLEQHLVGE